jgi:uncharacterized protein YkwD
MIANNAISHDGFAGQIRHKAVGALVKISNYATAQEALTAWLNSPTHKQLKGILLILNCSTRKH